MQKRQFFLNPMAFILIGSLIGWYFYVGQMHVSYTMDSLTYRDVALNILHGNGLVTTNTFETTPEFFSVLQWPAAYPALWALLAAIGIDIDTVPKIITPLLYTITLVLMYLIGSQLAKNKLAGAITTFLYVALPTGLAIFNFAWSETLFIPLILLAFLALLQYSVVQGYTKVTWLGVAALSIGLANWTRYTGAIFLPLLFFSVWLMTEGLWVKKLKNAFLTAAFSMLIVAPLWIRNYIMTGLISGSSRGGHTKSGAAEKLVNDLETLWNLLVYPVFNFDTVSYALLGFPLLVLIIYAVWKNKTRLSSPGKPIALAFTWAAINLVFILSARIFQQGIDFDYRMLAIPAPFAVAGIVAWLTTERRKSAQSALLATVVVMMSITCINEGDRIHDEITNKLNPSWRVLAFGAVWTDMHKDYAFSKGIKLPPMTDDTVILTDYRGVFMRYLTNHLAYQVVSTNCATLKHDLKSPVVFVMAQPTKFWYFDNSQTLAAKCARESPNSSISLKRLGKLCITRSSVCLT